MRIYKTRYDFENLDQSEIFPGTICTITDEVDNPTYIYQNSIWNAFVTVPQSEEISPTGVYINNERAPVPVWSASETALNGSGGIVRRAPSFALYNPAGLHRWRGARSVR